jgi:putative ABC transport system substrate-binding protein
MNRSLGLSVGAMGLALLVVFAAGVLAAPLKIGICKILDHPALNAVEQGTIETLTEAGFLPGTDVEYLIGDAQGDPNNAIPIAQNFAAQGVSLVVAISTPMALAAAEVFDGTDVPIVFSAVTNPLAVGLVLSDTDPSQNGNITGVSDLIDVGKDLALLKELDPTIQRIGLVYNPGEANSDLLTGNALAAAPGLGLTIVTAIADTTANVTMAAQSLLGRVDAFYVTTDNTVVSAIDAIIAAAEEAGVPFLMADPTSLSFGPVLATGHDYYKHGLLTGDVVAQILGGASPDEIAVVYQKNPEVYINLDAAAAIDLEIPQSVTDQAAGIYYGGTTWTREAE